MRRQFAHGEAFDSVIPLGEDESGDFPGVFGRTGRMAALGVAAAMALGSVTVPSTTGTDHLSAAWAARVADATTHAAGDVLTLFASPVHAAANLFGSDNASVAPAPVGLPSIDVSHVASAMNRSRLVAQDWANQAEAAAAVARQAAADAAAAQQQAAAVAAAAAQQAAARAAAEQAIAQRAAAEQAIAQQAAEQAAAQEAAAQQAAVEQAAAEQAAAEQAAADQAAAEEAAAEQARAAQRNNGGGSNSDGGSAWGGRAAAVAAAVAAPALVAASPATLGTAGAAGQTTAAEDQFVDLVNIERARLGLPALQFDGSLLHAARSQANVIASTGSLSHQSLSPLLGPFRVAGENVGYGPSIGVVNDALVHSPGHYANMVNPSFRYMATAVVTTPDGRYWVSQVYGG
ncbi:MAG: hypothetical protein QOJ19_1940 [Acidimicrobiia bacterium]|jgi:uncharacterized protein YkwD|nr:hypothetical protein [Acidimicrobiia bacterium]